MRVEERELSQESSGWILLAFVSRPKVIEEDETETADELGELERQAAVSVA